MLINNDAPILIVEDNDEDFDIFELSFRAAGAKNMLVRCLDGQQALQCIAEQSVRGESQFALIILDLNLGAVDGRDVLRRIRENQVCNKLPVMVLSTSANPADIDFCYSNGANCYTIKPVDLARFERLIALIKEFWIDNMILPYQLHGVSPG